MNHTSTSTDSRRPDLSERSHAYDEPTVDCAQLLDLLENQFADLERDILPDILQSNATEGALLDATAATEECVDLKPLLPFGNSDELLIDNVDKIESICDPAEKANYFVLSKIDRYDNPTMSKLNVIYTQENLSAAQSPTTADTLDEEFFLQRPNSIETSAQMPDFTYSDNDFLMNGNDVLNSVPACNNIITTENDNVKAEVMYYTPENSSSPSHHRKIFELPKFDLSKIQIFKEDIRTPDIINSIIEYEKSNNMPKKVTLTNFIAEEEMMPSTSSTFLDPYINSPSSGVPSPASLEKSSKKRYLDDDSEDDFIDDENDRDYVPYEEPKSMQFRSAKRGRPPKRIKSISSDDYSQLDPQEAKYREMRDRNNEASRRSRYKRKQKEMKVVDELEIEEERNVKLKAEVEELQKTVDRFRDSLMKVMLSKR